MTITLEAPPAALYIHLPWCVRKCPYCDFNSHVLPDDPDWAGYGRALLRDLDAQTDRSPLAGSRPFRSVFFGGGTPSLAPPRLVGDLLDRLAADGRLAADAEVTLEANPGTADTARFDGYRAAGVNRVSVGVQSFDDRNLHALGRIHDAGAAHAAVAMARQRFERVNIDLMYGLPDQDVAGAVADLDSALALGVEHVSWYELTIEPNTEFWRRPPARPDEPLRLDIEAAGVATLTAAGLRRYEVSAWARPGQQSRHNVNYWTFGDYVGIGAGAHGKWTVPDLDEVWRTRLTRHPAHHLRAVAAPLRRTAVARADRAFEYLMNALRLLDGTPVDDFTRRTGLPWGDIAATVVRLQRDGLLEPARDTLKVTPRGLAVLDSVLAEFLPEPGPHRAQG